MEWMVNIFLQHVYCLCRLILSFQYVRILFKIIALDIHSVFIICRGFISFPFVEVACSISNFGCDVMCAAWVVHARKATMLVELCLAWPTLQVGRWERNFPPFFFFKWAVWRKPLQPFPEMLPFPCEVYSFLTCRYSSCVLPRWLCNVWITWVSEKLPEAVWEAGYWLGKGGRSARPGVP